MTTIPTRPLGPSGILVPVVGLGCNQFGNRLDLAGTRAVLDGAIDAGVSFLDTADRYGGTKSESFIGEALKGRRDQVVLATKFGLDIGDGWGGPRGARDYIHHAVEASLRRLQTDVIDLYWYHRPDGVTPIAETLGALHELVEAGTVRAIGASNFTAAQIEEADAAATRLGLTHFSAIQNEYSLLRRDAETDVLPVCRKLGIAFIPYYPLAAGLLTGKYHQNQAAPAGTRLAGRAQQLASPEEWTQIESLRTYAEARGLTLAHVAIGALIAEPAVASVIAGATSAAQVQANASAASWQPSDDDLDELRGLLA